MKGSPPPPGGRDNDTLPGQIRILGVFVTKMKEYLIGFQNELMYSVRPRPSATANNTPKSNGQGWVRHSICPLFHFLDEYPQVFGFIWGAMFYPIQNCRTALLLGVVRDN